MPASRTRSSPSATDGSALKKRTARTTAKKKSPARKTKSVRAKPARIRKPPVEAAADRIGNPAPGEGLPLIDRVERSIEREISRIEEIIGGRHVDAEQQSDAERRARTLASLTRTLFELRRLRDSEEKRPLDDDAVPRDLDELRRALSQRLDQMVAGPTDISAAGDE